MKKATQTIIELDFKLHHNFVYRICMLMHKTTTLKTKEQQKNEREKKRIEHKKGKDI